MNIKERLRKVQSTLEDLRSFKLEDLEVGRDYLIEVLNKEVVHTYTGSWGFHFKQNHYGNNVPGTWHRFKSEGDRLDLAEEDYKSLWKILRPC